MTEDVPIINEAVMQETRNTLGPDFIRILGYFREDGTKSVAAIEEAMRLGQPAPMVIPAHTLKGESYQFGAERLGMLAEHLEMTARHCVEIQESPEELIAEVASLRGLFEETMALLEKDTNPLVQRRGFGRRAATGGAFGRGAG